MGVKGEGAERPGDLRSERLEFSKEHFVLARRVR